MGGGLRRSALLGRGPRAAWGPRAGLQASGAGVSVEGGVWLEGGELGPRAPH